MSMGMKYVEIEKDGHVGTCVPAALPVWEKHGWTAVDDGDSETDSTETATDAVNDDNQVDLVTDTQDKE
jgi:hypothetical protein